MNTGCEQPNLLVIKTSWKDSVAEPTASSWADVCSVPCNPPCCPFPSAIVSLPYEISLVSRGGTKTSLFSLSRERTVAAAVRLTIKECRVGGKIMVETQSVGGTISILWTATIRVKGEHDVQERDKCSLVAVQWVQHTESELASRRKRLHDVGCWFSFHFVSVWIFGTMSQLWTLWRKQVFQNRSTSHEPNRNN